MGGNTSTTTQNNKPYEAAQPLIDQGLADARQMYEQGGFNITPYGGPLVASPDAFSQAAYGMAPGAVGGALQGAQAAQGGLLRALDPSMRSGAFDQVRENTIASIMPSINSSFAGSGMTGSSLHAQNLARGLSQGLGEVENAAWQQGEGRALQAAGMMGQANQNMLAPLDYLRSVGSERQAQSQAEIQAAALQDQQAKTAELNALQDYLALSSGAGSMFGVQQSTQRQNPGAMGILGLGLQAAPLLFSDRRLKRDIEPLGKRGAHQWYRFRYVWDEPGTVHEGVMAQEVERVAPHAVHEVAGYKVVDYAAI